MVVVLQKRIYREDLRANPNVLYLFGDNTKRVGLGGQAAEMRGEPNAFGIATKWAPDDIESSFFNDDDECFDIIDRDFDKLEAMRLTDQIIVIPLDGLGTGLSQLRERAPGCLDLIEERLKHL